MNNVVAVPQEELPVEAQMISLEEIDQRESADTYVACCVFEIN